MSTAECRSFFFTFSFKGFIQYRHHDGHCENHSLCPGVELFIITRELLDESTQRLYHTSIIPSFESKQMLAMKIKIPRKVGVTSGRGHLIQVGCTIC